MRAITCPKCGAPLQAGMTFCPYCRVGLNPEAGEEPRGAGSGAREIPQAQIPAGWTLHRDPWHGFSIAHPAGWQVVTFQGQINVREDAAGLVSASIWPMSLQQPTSAYALATQFTQQGRAWNPSFQVWLPENAAPDSNRLSLRTRQTKYGQTLDGAFNVLVDGLSGIISGFQAPSQALAQHSETFSQILASFRPLERLPRQSFSDPTENAFALQAPQGWGFQGGINRNHIGGTGLPQFTVARDPQGKVAAVMPWYQWNLMDSGGGMLGGLFNGFNAFSSMSGYSSMPFTHAVQYATQQVAPWMSQAQANFKVESAPDRPDIAELFMIEQAKAGYAPGLFEITVTMLETTYLENGVRMRQKSRVSTQRQRSSGPFSGAAPMWMATLDIYYRAPDAEFAGWEPVLNGIFESVKDNPAWKAGEQRLAQNYIQNTQQDIHRRQQQIARTLSETSDLVANSYWERSAAYDRMSEQRSNATLGVQNMTNESGEVYKVPIGYDQYWQDGLGNLYGGSWLSQPEINWKPLTPTGI